MTPLSALTPSVDVDGPRVRLGLAWAAVTTLALLIGPVAIAGWLAVASWFAIRQAVDTWRGHQERPIRVVALSGSLLPIAAMGGPVAFAAGVALVGVAGGMGLATGQSRARVTVSAAIALLIGTGTSAPVMVAVEVGATPAFVLLLATFVFDASVYIVGSGTVHRWEGVAAGVASIASLTLGVAAVLVPPFRGASPWILGAVAVLAVPWGPLVATMVTGNRDRAVPALRRVDSLIVVGPVWAAGAAALLR